MSSKRLTELNNIGKTVAARLHSIGIRNEAELKACGSAKAYKLLAGQTPNKHLAVCYYLYSLEGAIQNRHWDDFSKDEKRRLRLSAGLSK